MGTNSSEKLKFYWRGPGWYGVNPSNNWTKVAAPNIKVNVAQTFAWQDNISNMTFFPEKPRPEHYLIVEE